MEAIARRIVSDYDDLSELFATEDAEAIILLRYLAFRVHGSSSKVKMMDVSDIFASLSVFNAPWSSASRRAALATLQQFRNASAHFDSKAKPSLQDLADSCTVIQAWLEQFEVDGSEYATHKVMCRLARLLSLVLSRTVSLQNSSARFSNGNRKSTIVKEEEQADSGDMGLFCPFPNTTMSNPTPNPIAPKTSPWNCKPSGQVPAPKPSARAQQHHTEEPDEHEPEINHHLGSFKEQRSLSWFRDNGWKEKLKGRAIVAVDGKHAGRKGVFKSWSGTIGWVVFDDSGERVALSVERIVGVLRRS